MASEHEPGALLERVPTWALATALTAVLGLAYVIAAPPSTDLAAAAYRSTLFSHVGFTLWDNSWYGGHHLPAYSLLAPALGAWLGPQLLNALAMVAATALFALLIDGCFPARATRIAAIWFAIGASFALLANRVPYDLGLALGLGALLVLRGASERGRTERSARGTRPARGGARAGRALRGREPGGGRVPRAGGARLDAHQPHRERVAARVADRLHARRAGADRAADARLPRRWARSRSSPRRSIPTSPRSS